MGHLMYKNLLIRILLKWILGDKHGRLGEHSISWKSLRFASWFPTLISCFPNLPRVYIMLCKHGNHFTFLQYIYLTVVKEFVKVLEK